MAIFFPGNSTERLVMWLQATHGVRVVLQCKCLFSIFVPSQKGGVACGGVRGASEGVHLSNMHNKGRKGDAACIGFSASEV